MATLIICLAVLAIFSLLYETCILPDVRSGLEYGIFAARDELRAARIRGEIIDTGSYQVLSDNINNAILVAPVAELSWLPEADEILKNNPDLKKWVTTRVTMLNACSDPIIKKIRRDVRKLSISNFLVGSGGLIFNVLPLLIIVFCWDALKELIRKILSLPEDEVANFINTQHSRDFRLLA